jgi:hypothetical protein
VPSQPPCSTSIKPRNARTMSAKGPFAKITWTHSSFLSCVNQYYYYRYATLSSDKIEAKKLEDRRNRALFFGLFRPLSTRTSLEQRTSLPVDVTETRFLLASLANHFCMLRKRGVIPMIISLIWFFLSFIISLVLAFQQVGKSTTGHSLGLGLVLSWLPAFVLMTIVDRNPVSPMRCKVHKNIVDNIEEVLIEPRPSLNVGYTMSKPSSTTAKLPNIRSRNR